MAVRVGLVQTFKKSLSEGLALVEEALERGSQIVLLPEKWVPESEENTVADDRHPYLQGLRELSSSYPACIVGGAVPEKASDGLYITAYVAVGGEIVGKARKLHLFQSEKKRFRRGVRPLVFDFQGFRLGVAVCYDLDFPETVRAYTLLGCDLLLAPAKIVEQAWPAWMVYVNARVLENRLPVAFANVCQPPYFQGGSSLVEPELRGPHSNPFVYPAIRRMGESEGVGVFEAHPEEFRTLRQARLSDRNLEVDALRLEPV